MTPISFVIFDLDGTLCDTRKDIAASVNAGLQAHGLPPAPEPVITSFVGDGVGRLVDRTVAHVGGDIAVAPAVAEALGKVGTAAAVAPLRNMAGRFPFDLGLRRASRQAIAEIQSRLTGATPGQLALADGGSGQLSLAEEGLEGRVSVAAEGEADAEAEGDGATRWPTDGSPEPGVHEGAPEVPAPHPSKTEKQ